MTTREYFRRQSYGFALAILTLASAFLVMDYVTYNPAMGREALQWVMQLLS